MQPDEFKRIRKAAGLTQKQLAALLGLSGVWISNMEGGSAAIEPRTELSMLWIAANHKAVQARLVETFDVQPI